MSFVGAPIRAPVDGSAMVLKPAAARAFSPGGDQRLELAGGEDAVARHLLAELESDDGIARALAEGSVGDPVVQAEPDERVLRRHARRERQARGRRPSERPRAASAAAGEASRAAFAPGPRRRERRRENEDEPGWRP